MAIATTGVLLFSYTAAMADWNAFAGGMKLEANGQAKTDADGRSYYEQTYAYDTKNDKDSLSQLLFAITGHFIVNFTQKYWLDGPDAGTATFTATIKAGDGENQDILDRTKIRGREYDPSRPPPTPQSYKDDYAAAKKSGSEFGSEYYSSKYSKQGEHYGAGYAFEVDFPFTVSIGGNILGTNLSDEQVKEMKHDLIRLVNRALRKKIVYTEDRHYNRNKDKKVGQIETGRSWQKVAVTNTSGKAMGKIDVVADFLEAGLAPRAVTADPKVGIDFNSRTVTASVRKLLPGESMTFKVLISGPRRLLEVPVKITAVIGGEVVRGSYFSPILNVVSQAPAPSGLPPPVLEMPKPSGGKLQTDTGTFGGVSGDFPSTPIQTEHNPEDSREAAEEAMERIEEGGGLFPPPTIFDRLRSLWPF